MSKYVFNLTGPEMEEALNKATKVVANPEITGSETALESIEIADTKYKLGGGQPSGTVWGQITGELSDQTDLQSELSAKQDTLVSGTNIKKINNQDILGQGNLNISGFPTEAIAGTAMIYNGIDWVKQTGYGYEDSGSQVTIVWNGDTEGRDSFFIGDMQFYKIGDKPVTNPASISIHVVIESETHDFIAKPDAGGINATSYSFEVQPSRSSILYTICDATSDCSIIVQGSQISFTPPSIGLYAQKMPDTVFTTTYSSPAITHQINSKFIPEDTILANAKKNSGIGWKTGGSGNIFTWNGDITGKINFGECYHITNTVVPQINLVGSTYIFNNHDIEVTHTVDYINDLSEEVEQPSGTLLMAGDSNTSSGYMVSYTTFTYDGSTYPAGTWFQYISSNDYMKQVSYGEPTTVHQIASEFIPHDITKQDTLMSGTNIKSINNSSILTSGNIELVSDVTINNNSIVENHVAKIIYETGLGSDSNNSATVTAIRNFVNSSIESVVAYYLTADTSGNAFATKAALDKGPWYYAGSERTPIRNDYAIVIADETHDNKSARYVYVKTDSTEKGQWAFQYTFNMSFTQAQIDAINSGINTTKVALYDALLQKVPETASSSNQLADKMFISDNYVAKETGKGLSTNDYTTNEQTKLSGIETGAQVNAVTSVAGQTGDITLSKTDIGLENIDNTSDLNKPISTAVQNALDEKQAVLSDGINIKTINKNSILGKGNLNVGNIIYDDSEVGSSLPMPHLYWHSIQICLSRNIPSVATVWGTCVILSTQAEAFSSTSFMSFMENNPSAKILFTESSCVITESTTMYQALYFQYYDNPDPQSSLRFKVIYNDRNTIPTYELILQLYEISSFPFSDTVNQIF